MSAEDFNTLLQKSDPDRRLSALFATEAVRERLFALYAFNQEVARIAEATSESLIGEMKLTWWRDAVEDLYLDEPKVRRHAVPEALAGVTDRLDREALLGLIAARFDDVSARPYADLGELVAYVDQTAGALMHSALQASECDLPDDWARQGGRAWGLCGLLRAFAHRASIGRAPVAGDELVSEGGSAAMLAQGLGEDKAARLVEPVRAACQGALDAFNALGPIPAEAVPALGYVRLVPSYLKRLPANPYEMAPEPALLGRQLRLNWLALTGR